MKQRARGARRFSRHTVLPESRVRVRVSWVAMRQFTDGGLEADAQDAGVGRARFSQGFFSLCVWAAVLSLGPHGVVHPCVSVS